VSTALITGGSAGLGKALATELATRGWRLIITGRNSVRLRAVAAELATFTSVTAFIGNVADAAHRGELIAEVARIGSLDLLVNNASNLGPTPLRALAELSIDDVRDVFAVNATGPFALTAALLPALTEAKGTVIAISSDAAVEHYPDWGGYGASKAALDHLTLTFGVENLDIACYAIDPGDMLTDMARDAFPGEDIGDRRSPTEIVPALLYLIQRRPPGGRYRAADGLAVRADAAGTRSAEPATPRPTEPTMPTPTELATPRPAEPATR
jgi:NAD(P)-dependent dehydrogenase (short-subunit alcohol dehydrogenase family)